MEWNVEWRFLTRDCPDCEARHGLWEGDLLTRDYPDYEACEGLGGSACLVREVAIPTLYMLSGQPCQKSS